MLAFAFLALIGPSIWVKRTMLKYSEPSDRYPFTGHLFAEKLL
ncbi:MAG: peptidase, partial [Chloroflexi bacterium]|nr:peptidase [Chloroflexota bacterium]